MRRLLLILALVLWASAPAQAAIAFVQQASSRANDPTTTFSPAPLNGNHVVVLVIMNSTAQTASIDATGAVSLVAATDGSTLRAYAWCYPGDGADTDFVVTTSGGASAMVVAAEISGGSCTKDGTEATTATTGGSASNFTYTTTKAGSFVMSAVHSTSVSDFGVATGTCIPASCADLGGGNGVGIGVGQYYTAGAAGAQTTIYTNTSETYLLLVVGVEAATASLDSAGMLLKGVGGDQ